MLTAHTSAPASPPPSGPFTWECDACEAKETTAAPILPADWTQQTGMHDQATFCPDCSNRGNAASEWEL